MRRTRGGEAFDSPPIRACHTQQPWLEGWNFGAALCPYCRSFPRTVWHGVSEKIGSSFPQRACGPMPSVVVKTGQALWGWEGGLLGIFLFFFLFCAARVYRFVTVWDGAAAPFPRTSMRIVVQGRLKLGSTHAAAWDPSHESSPWDPTRQRLMRTPAARSEHAPCEAAFGTTGGRWRLQGKPPSASAVRGRTRMRCSNKGQWQSSFCISPWDGRY